MKKRSIVLLGVLAVLLNSCVYSLFPIYTEDTLVFKSELIGTWDLGGNSVMKIEKGKEDEEAKEEEEYKYTLEIKEGFTISSNDPIFITINGEKVYDEEIIREEMLRRMAEKEEYAKKYVHNEPKDQKRAEKALKKKDIEYEGSVSVYEDKSYKLTVTEENGSELAYTAHLVEIGGDLFMDLYPITNYNSKDFSDNYFPVHTFYKVEISEDTFTMIHFDLDKLNDLFKSNLIRLRHENVDGTILITAQPKELQKFINKYAEDESVFDHSETYTRVSL